jgi:hypothetical protein
MKAFQLVRVSPGQTEITSVTGVVAEAAVFSDGLAVLHWLTNPACTEIYPAPDGEGAMRAVRESSGRSQFRETGKITFGRPGENVSGTPVLALPELMMTPGGADRGDLPS